MMCGTALSQNSILDVGLRIQKSVSFYNENGVSVQYSDRRLKPDRLYLGFTYVTSRLGSAFGSNAVKQDNFLASASWYARSGKRIRPFGTLNTGFFRASYEEAIFDVLPNKSLIVAPELGVGVRLDIPLRIGASVGYNIITGDGLDGPGTLYPLFIQTTVSWSLLEK